jgi:hypothetical protein
MMETRGSLVFQFPSFLPKSMAAEFPDWAKMGEAHTVYVSADGPEEVLKRCEEAGNRKSIFLFNPPTSLIKRLPGSMNICVAFDMLPHPAAIPLFKPFRVLVPSLAFRSVFRRHGVDAEVVHPKPKIPEKIREKREQFRKRLRIGSHHILTWVDERLVSSRLRPHVFAGLQRAVKQAPLLRVAWVSRRAKQEKNGIHIVEPQASDRELWWLASDLLVTAAPIRQSLAPVHLQSLAAGIPVMTGEGGDHDEWVNHLFAGAMISRKAFQKELRHYLLRAASDPGWIGEMKHCARFLAQIAMEEK